jgi:hypothetical protein
MAQQEQLGALFSLEDGSWSVWSQNRRLVFRNGHSALEIPVQGPLRWARDGKDLSFAEALAAVPAELHGWMSLAGLIALRECMSGLFAGVALPAGYQEWQVLTARADAACAWMQVLCELEDAQVPSLPPDLDDGLGDEDAPA